MLGKQLVDAKRLRSPRQMVERSIAFKKRDCVAKAVENWQQFAEAPYAGVVQRLGQPLPSPPQPLQRARVGTVRAAALAPAWVFDFKKVPADCATEVGQRIGARNPSSAAKTA